MMFIKVAVILATVCLSGAVYTRWGREDCSGSSTLVYAGYAGGSYFNHPGGAAEYICLPKDPDFVSGISKKTITYVYGAEYQFRNMIDKDVPCAVCLEPGSSSPALMIPAKKSCYSGWSVAYNGFLGSGYYGHPAASQFICVDDEPAAVPGGDRNRDGKLIYPVSAYAGHGLKFPPYKHNEILACVVCVKN